MGRVAREKSESGIYHVVTRGINRQDIFYDDEDCLRYLETLARYKKEGKFTLLGYCLMGNHLHLLLQEKMESISVIMKRIGTSYAWWYNNKYERTGHVFQGRYKSECVNDEAYLLTAIRYIHQNPVKAEVAAKPEAYRWSSCRAYFTGNEYPAGLTDTDTVLSSFKSCKQSAGDQFHQFMGQKNDERCLEDIVKKKICDSALKKEIERLAGGISVSVLQSMERAEMNKILVMAKELPGSSLRQISRVTGIGISIIARA